MLRPWRESDRPALLRHINDPRIARNTRRVPYPYTDADATTWLSYAATDPPPSGVYAIEVASDDGPEAVGTIAFVRGENTQEWCWEVGYWLALPYWGRGIMTEALRLVTEAAWQVPELIRLYAVVFSWNPPSMRVLEKVGYRREAVLERSGIKNGTVIDSVIYAMTRDTGLPYARFQPISS